MARWREDSRKLLTLLLLIDLFLVACYLGERSVGSSFWIVQRLADLDGERSLGTWFSTVQLFALACMVLVKAFRPGTLAPLGSGFLFTVAFGFMFLSMDEALSIHESLTQGLKHMRSLPRFEGDHGLWMPIYLSMAGAFALVSLKRMRFLWQAFRAPAGFLFAGLGVYLAGAAGVEALGYQLDSAAGTLLRVIQVACEEGLEMAGVSLLLVGAWGLVLEEASGAVAAPTAADARQAPGL